MLQIVAGIEKNANILKNCILRREACTTDIDLSFYKIIDCAMYVDKEILVQNTLKSLKEYSQKNLDIICQYYNNFSHFWGTINLETGDYTVIRNRIDILKDRANEFVDLYEMLEDYRSKMVLLSIVRYWMNYDIQELNSAKENNYCDYYDHDIIHCTREEVLVDCGAYDGDSALQFMKSIPNYKKIICYEMDEANYKKCVDNLAPYENIEVRNKGVGKENINIKISASRGTSSSMYFEGDRDASIVKMDDDIKEKVTMIKMDIEGAEKDALIGASRIIKEDKPKLLICVYHGNTDYLDVPELIKSLRPDYKLYMRSNVNQFGPAEIVLFAV